MKSFSEIFGRIWDWERSLRVVHFSNQQSKLARITSMEFLNGHDDALLLVGSDDGSCRIWRDIIPVGSRNGTLNGDEINTANIVSAWNCVGEMTPSTRCPGLILDWDQESLQLLASGDVRSVRVWDVQREYKVMDIGTGSESFVTAVHHNPNG